MKNTIVKLWKSLGTTGQLILGLTLFIFIARSFSSR